MSKKTVRILLLWLCLHISVISLGAAPPDQSALGQYEVRVFSHRDYVGDSQSYQLNTRTHRILLVNRFPQNLDNAISSIHVGSEVYAILFDYHDFHISMGLAKGGNWFTGLVNALVDIHKKMTPLGYMGGNKPSQGPTLMGGDIFGQINVGVYTNSSPMVQHNDIYTSMLVIPKSLDYAYGVALYNPGDNFIRVEPIPDEIRFTERRIPDFGSYLNNKIAYVAFLGPRIRNTHLTLYDQTHYKGQAITLPGVASDKITFNLVDFNFAAKTQSIRLGITPIKMDSVRVAAPPADQATVQEIMKVIPIPVMTLMVDAVPAKPQTPASEPAPSAQAAQGTKHPPPAQTSGWGQQPNPPPPQEPQQAQPTPRPQEEQYPPQERPEPRGWEQERPEPPREELPPGIADMRGRWRDNHGNFFEIIQHGPDFILIGDAVPVHGAGIQYEGGRLSLIIRTGEAEVQRLEGRIDAFREREPAQRIELDNHIVLNRAHETWGG